MNCAHCNSLTSVRFVCKDCSKNTDEVIKFYVCNKQCQEKFWTLHKQNGHQHFPHSFANLGEKAGSFDSEVERALTQLQILRNYMSHEVQIDFENADLENNFEWMKSNWDSFKKGMVFHALASFGTFQWESFFQWLKENANHDGAAKEALELFKKHPAYIEN